jgi:hypothetical protein
MLEGAADNLPRARHPHHLSHTRAAKAINRGMNLGAIAALPGHKPMSMTLTYARTADRTVADEYSAVGQQVGVATTPRRECKPGASCGIDVKKPGQRTSAQVKCPPDSAGLR